MVPGRPFLLLLLASVTARVVVVPFLPDLSFAALPASTQVFYEVLRDRLPEYVAFTFYRPPVTYLVQGAIVAVGGPEGAYEGRSFLWVTFALDTAAVLLLYLACVQLGVRRWVAAVILTLCSLALIPWELWRDGAHYDHLTIPLAAAFAASCIAALGAPSLRTALLVAATGSVYVAQSPTALYAAPPAAAAALLLAAGPSLRRRLTAALIAALVPLAVAAPIVARNVSETRALATGHQGGAVLMIFVHEVTKDLPDQASAIFSAGTVPAWYRWCYEHATPPPGLESDIHWAVLARSFGICFPWTDLTSASWPFDMTPLRTEIAKSGDERILAIVDRDIADMRERRWLYAGFSPEQSPRWMGVYGTVTQRLALEVFRSHPVRATQAFAVATARYVRYGPFLPARVTEAPRDSGMRTLERPLPFELVFRGVTLAFGLLAIAGTLAVPLLASGGIVALARRRASLADRAAVVLAIPIAILSVLLILAAWDVDRYFMQIVPYVLLFTAMIPVAVARWR